MPSTGSRSHTPPGRNNIWLHLLLALNVVTEHFTQCTLTLPHPRQWCLLKVKVNSALHAWHMVTLLSGTMIGAWAPNTPDNTFVCKSYHITSWVDDTIQCLLHILHHYLMVPYNVYCTHYIIIWCYHTIYTVHITSSFVSVLYNVYGTL